MLVALQGFYHFAATILRGSGQGPGELAGFLVVFGFPPPAWKDLCIGSQPANSQKYQPLRSPDVVDCGSMTLILEVDGTQAQNAVRSILNKRYPMQPASRAYMYNID